MNNVITGCEALPRLTSLEEMEAQRIFKRFGAENKEEYSKKIDSMSSFDLSAHAASVGVRPISERYRNRAALISAFERAKVNIIATANSSKSGSVDYTDRAADNYSDFMTKFAPR